MNVLKYISRIFVCIVILTILFIWLSFFKKDRQKWDINLISKDTILSQLHTISKLETAEITISKTISANTDLWDRIEWTDIDDYVNKFLFQDSMEFSLTWKVVAWIDLEKVTKEDITRHLDWSININLPEAEILYVSIDDNAIPQRQLWILAGWWNTNMETELRNAAKLQMKQEAIDAGILETANEKANSILANIMETLWTNINWEWEYNSEDTKDTTNKSTDNIDYTL